MSWETHFDELKNQMIHTFQNGIVVNFNRNFGIATVAKDGEPINSFDASEMTTDEWHRFLINTGKQAEEIKQQGGI